MKIDRCADTARVCHIFKSITINKMKKQMTFNHSAETITEALGITLTSDDVAQMMTDLSRKFLNYIDSDDDDKLSASRLAEMIHEDIPYEVILFLITSQTLNTIKDAQEKLMSDLFNELKHKN